MIKRMIDIILSFLALLVLAPIILLVAVLVRKKLGSPIIFKQLRPGRNGEIFQLYKFRTMTDEKDEDGELLPDTVRLTNFGQLLRKLSLDELPQLWNILKGDMSFVGPRPLLVEYLPLYNERQARRHDVRPGITGWAQVNGRNAISWEQKFEYDVWYVQNQSLFLDFKILFLTFKKVLQSEGINQPGQATNEKFKGSGAEWKSF
ncbi:sugar transferase [Ureibacillus sinduriensis]|uniref:Sugar transferase n=1 Tax=Ureibacillus sinduriensis BLB-1 = JCM 15800 TaxID=1384057 RepID=A0A0A3HNL0_9BACL|nr:sugar transferase [Ureibacillus sinduriensis]KGR73974.1 sugar transferase [Ureibacillus sinduriensis BLB-1 = JCM 15800]